MHCVPKRCSPWEKVVFTNINASFLITISEYRTEHEVTNVSRNLIESELKNCLEFAAFHDILVWRCCSVFYLERRLLFKPGTGGTRNTLFHSAVYFHETCESWKGFFCIHVEFFPFPSLQMTEQSISLSDGQLEKLLLSSSKGTADLLRGVIADNCAGMHCFLRIKYKHLRKKSSRKKNCPIMRWVMFLELEHI